METRPSVAVLFRQDYFSEFAVGCSECFANSGSKTARLNSVPEDGLWDAILVVGIHEFPKMPFYRQSLLLGVQTEQLPISRIHSGRLTRNLKRFRAVRGYYDRLFEWNPSVYAAGTGGQVFIPYGCRPRKMGPSEPKYDLMFVGNVGGSSRRKELLEDLSRRFTLYPDFSPGFGARKDEGIRSSRICLNIHYYDNCGFESPRVFDYASRGAFILSERTADTFPFVVGRDLEDFGSKEELFDKVAYFLDHDEERARIAAHGYSTATANSFERASEIIILELERRLRHKAASATRYLRWKNARARCAWFALRDYVSLKRRGKTGSAG